VSDFGDIERFARAHASCGGITPNASTQMSGGYLLTLTCVCGATMDRWITPEEAKLPLPMTTPPSAAPSPVPPKEPAPEKPEAPAPSTDLQEALRQALEAEDATESKVRPAPAASPSPSTDLEEALRLAIEAEPPVVKAPAAPPVAKPATPPVVKPPAAAPPSTPRVPITNLEEAVQRALEADARAAEAAAAAAARPRERPAQPRLNLDAAMQRAVDSQTVVRAAPPRATSRFWFAAVVVVLVIGGVVFWLGLRALDEEARSQTQAPAPAAVGAPPTVSETERTALTEALRALRDVQAVSTSTVSYSVYSGRVAFAKADVNRYLGVAAAPELKAAVRDTMELHVLATAAWRARSLESKDAWEAIGQDPAIDLCPSAKRVVDFADTPAGQSRAHARGVSVAAAIPLLWDCAASRLTGLDR
jgi:hypothetical protein